MNRIPYDATTEDEVIQYFKTRQLQLASKGFSWDRVLYKNNYGYFVNFVEESSKNKFNGFYVPKQNRNKGFSKKLIESLGIILTIGDCNVEDFLNKNKKTHIVVNGVFDTLEYKLVEQFYGDKKANRSQLWLMNHVDEGMIILNHLKKSKESQAGFCLHPMLQMDNDLKDNFNWITKENISSYNLGLALEYRNIANQYLSKRSIESISDIVLSPLQEVNDMLIADKIQNYKDFIIHHKGTHPRSEILENYFNNWLTKLNCHDEFNWFIRFSNELKNEIKVVLI
ncbi:hypothetical protein GW796_06060 [archaeon]|nr:hypothetical protein [archaeon]